MMEFSGTDLPDQATQWPVLICLLGRFQVLKRGHPIALHGAKAERLLCALAIQHDGGIERDTLLHILWPDHDAELASHSLYTLLHDLRTLLSDVLGGAPPVLHQATHYHLNSAAGVGVDIRRFEELATLGESQYRVGNELAAIEAYSRAFALYHGDLCSRIEEQSFGIRAVVERERLRVLYLKLRVRLADYYYASGDYQASLDNAQCILDTDPCREDAHRIMMRCYVLQGQRAQAIHHYHFCEDILRIEFNGIPEPATTKLFEQICHAPESLDPTYPDPQDTHRIYNTHDIDNYSGQPTPQEWHLDPWGTEHGQAPRLAT